MYASVHWRTTACRRLFYSWVTSALLRISRLPPDDDYLIIVRACVALGLYPDAEWAVSVMPVDACCGHVASLALAGSPTVFDAVPIEVKGKLFSWETLYSWIHEVLPLKRCSLAGWKLAVHAAAAAGRDENCSRVSLLMVSIEDEFHAEMLRMKEGDHVLHSSLACDPSGAVD